MTIARVLADLTVGIHITTLLYIGLGGFLAWRWFSSIFVHVFFALWGIAVNVFPIPCPLTALEDYLRRLQGLGPLPGGFNAYYIYGTIFPRSLLPLVAVSALVILVVSYVGAYSRWRHRETAPARRVRQA